MIWKITFTTRLPPLNAIFIWHMRNFVMEATPLIHTKSHELVHFDFLWRKKMVIWDLNNAVNSVLATCSSDFSHLLITFANSLDLYQDPNRLTLW